MDDVHRSAVLHPGPVIIPAALATAIQTQAHIDRVLEAIVRGYEISIRLGRAVGLGHYRHWHPSSTCGALGAAMAAACVRGLDEPRTAWALANAGTRTGGLWQMRHEAVPSKALHTALAAHSGWLAAGLAAQGFSGPLSLLEGEQGLFAAMAPEADSAALIAPADQWLIHEVSFKPWPACRHAHPAMDALMALDALPEPESIDSVSVETYQAALDFCDCPHPATPGQARFSIQHALASILVHGRPRMRHYEPDALNHARVHNLRSRIQLSGCSRFNKAFPDHFGAAVRIRTRGGEQRVAAVADAWGDPEWPLSDTDLAAKAGDLFEHAGLETARAQRIIEQTLSLTNRGEQPAIASLRTIWS
jgi:2-methylcitrate dehydratase PrpD